ncbi:hypothetical protein DEJ28_14215 [Curtobacterium sp. MCPF17_002]|uniref:hypothetical protein n=1 Tax=Curtobacterium sp. MCPF17_002 TaxID=2175645 RepID=UPI000DA9902C|nr:hypothetical protein [Curtobacterium sp. MCPF17_002]WIB76797.1 hypothetical protein DEJ28_14215 [Curtobacterium sp. MCPF17_002]
MTGKTNAPGAGQGSEGETRGRLGNRVVAQFTPTDAERRKYADYSVEFRQSEQRMDLDVREGLVLRFPTKVRRVPSTKTFIVYLLAGASDEDRAHTNRVGVRMPQGEWARMPDMWCRRRAGNGQVYFQQYRGYVTDDDPLLRLSTEMLLENPLLIESDTDRPRLLL